VRRGGAGGGPRQHCHLWPPNAATARQPGARSLRQGARQGARIPRRHPRRVPWPTPLGALQRAGSADRRGPDPRKRDTVLAAVKAWPGGAGACRTAAATAILDRGRRAAHCRTAAATAILDGGCARRHWARAGRDEETVLPSNKETDQEEGNQHST